MTWGKTYFEEPPGHSAIDGLTWVQANPDANLTTDVHPLHDSLPDLASSVPTIDRNQLAVGRDIDGIAMRVKFRQRLSRF
jgi:hypothetical protein